jgi:hypothetical protein
VRNFPWARVSLVPLYDVEALSAKKEETERVTLITPYDVEAQRAKEDEMSKRLVSEQRLFVLYGPPGSGKSTTCGAVQVAGVRTLDLESIAFEHRRKVISTIHERVQVLGAADLKVEEVSSLIKGRVLEHILILPEREEYRARVANRDSLVPEKAGQKDYYSAFEDGKDQFDVVTSSAFSYLSKHISQISSVLDDLSFTFVDEFMAQ